MTPTAIYLQSLQRGQAPTDAELYALMTALHAAVLDTPLSNWLDLSFEDMADSVSRATACAELEEQQLEEV